MKTGEFGRVAVLYGGTSSEREISLQSGSAVLAALKARGVDAHGFDPSRRAWTELAAFERVFIALHGRPGEDGTVQGFLELLGIPYTGSGVLASSLAMDKWRSKLLWSAAGIPTPPSILLDGDSDFDAVCAELGLPLMVKPASQGSSIGMRKVEAAEDLPDAWRHAARYDRVVIAERWIFGQEYTAAILGDRVLPLIRVETPHAFYDYEAKYLASNTRYHCPAGVPPETEARLADSALRAFRLLGCRGWGRVDFIVDASGTPYFLEMNTAPGMTDHSLVPMAARAAGLSFEDLVIAILEQAHVG